MKKLLVALALTLWVVPAWTAMAAVDFFPVTADGSFDVHDQEGYANNGDGVFRLDKSNHHMGFMDWDGSVGDLSGQTLADFINDNGGVVKSATLYIRAAWGTLLKNQAAIITLRTGNEGNVVEDAEPSCCGTYDAPGDGIEGATEPFAWRAAAPPYSVKGGGVDVAWKMPSTATGWGGFGPGDEVKWQVGPIYRGWDMDERWAIEYVIGSSNSQNGTTPDTVAAAGQLLNSAIIGPDNYVGNEDPRNKAGDPNDDEWFKVAIDPEIILDLAFNPENKGIVFWGYMQGLVCAYGNDSVYSKDQSGGLWEPYLVVEVVPEPATLTLLALGGLLAIRRRRA